MDSPARERILGRLRRAVGGEVPAPESVCAPVVAMSPEEKIVRLKRLMEAVRSEVHVVDRGGWTETLRSVLRAHGAKSLLYAPGTWVGKAVDAVRAGGGEDFPEAVPYDGPVESLKETVFRVDAAVTTTRGAIAGVISRPQLSKARCTVKSAYLKIGEVHFTCSLGFR